KKRIEAANSGACAGVRMHWLLQDENTLPLLDQAGFEYDSTVGYNEAVGYRAGTGQVFCPLGVERLLELPITAQDGALFYPNRGNLSEAEAAQRCRAMIEKYKQHGGCFTTIWHDRSHAPERFWGDFYCDLISDLRESKPWFARAQDAVGWFEKRRHVKF